MMKNRFNCERSARPDENHGHIITGDLRLKRTTKLRRL